MSPKRDDTKAQTLPGVRGQSVRLVDDRRERGRGPLADALARRMERVRLVSVMTAAGLARCSELQILELAASGKIPSRRVKGRVFIDANALAALVKAEGGADA